MKPEDLADQLKQFDFDYFMTEALDRVPAAIDTRQGSIIYDALAPAAHTFAEMAMNLSNVVLNTYTQTAVGEFLDYRAHERGMTRESATYAQAAATITNQQGAPLVVTVGDRFASIGSDPIYYTVTKLLNVAGQVELTAEVAGEPGNAYVGQLLPVSAISDFGNATITEVTIPARDEETDEELRARLLSSNDLIEFGGNVADYIDFTVSLDDVAAVQVYPIWNGGGTVRVVILNNEYLAPGQTLINKVQGLIDPLDAPGDGYGIAPVGHVVTVAAPTLRTIGVSMTIETTSGVTVEDIRPDVTTAVEEYFEGVRRGWGKIGDDSRTYTVTIYRSQLIAAILKLDGVVNVANVKFDGADADITVITNATRQELPMLGTVTLNG